MFPGCAVVRWGFTGASPVPAQSCKHPADWRDKKYPGTAQVFPGCCGADEVSVVFHWGFTGVSLGLHWNFTGVSLGSHWGFSGVSPVPEWAAQADPGCPGLQGELSWPGRGSRVAGRAVLTCLLSGSVPCWPCRQAISLFWARWHTDLTVSSLLSICSAPGDRGGRENNTKTRSYFPGLSRKPSPPAVHVAPGCRFLKFSSLQRSAAA